MSPNPPTFDHVYVHRPRLWLTVIGAIYVALALNFAVQTPLWQAPDEPAHYNYIEHIATTGTLPVLRMGDYDQEYRDYLLANHFPSNGDYRRLRYESYQPPLYYLTGALVYQLSGGNVLALRLLNIGFGLILILLLYRTLDIVFPQRPMLTLGATAFTAFLPMHIAVTAAVNNDLLAELLVVASVMVLFTWMRQRFGKTGLIDSTGEPIESISPQAQWRLIVLGLLLGLGLLTKIYAYALVPLCLLSIIATIWCSGRSWQSLWRGIVCSLYTLIPTILLALPWWFRSIYYYGAWDFLGLRWHDQVVTGQPTTTAWIATHGIVSYSERAFNFTFQSFWGVFGWLGVFMDGRIYTALLVCTGILFLGLLWSMIRLISGKPDSDLNAFQRWVLLFFALMLVVVFASYVWYNLKFVQHQGRYFFWGLLPISTFVALGWREVMRPLQGVITGLLALILAISLAFTGYLGGGMNKWTVLTIGLAALLLLLQPLLFASEEGYTLSWLPKRFHRLAATHRGMILFRALRFSAWAAPILLLILLNALIPILYIVPQLTGHGHP